MRFKQALSRKLAAALSAVMILSTIAPTSVPVLAAAPDDVLVDSNVEYDLQDAGSEDVLLDSAESSLAEEADTLEVAGEELLSNEAASDEVLVDSAEEVLSEETGSEPVEVVEPAETAVTEDKIDIALTSSNIIKQFKYQYFDDSDNPIAPTDSESFVFDSASGNKIVSVDNAAYVVMSDIETVAGTPDDTYKITVSGNVYSGVEKPAENAAELSTLNGEWGAVHLEFNNEKPVTLKAEKTAFSGELHLKVVSADLITGVKVTSQNNAAYVTGEGIKNLTGADFGDGTKEIIISYNKAKKVKVQVPTANVPLDATIEDGDDKGYVLSANVAGKTTKEYIGDKKVEVNEEYEIPVTEDGNITATLAAKVNAPYNKAGNLVINVLSQNTVNNKVVSINTVTVSLNNYAIKWDVSTGKAVIGDYRASGSPALSTNDLTVKNWNGKIVVPYKYAGSADIRVIADDGNNDKGTKYAYQVGNDVFYKDASGVTPPAEAKQYTTVTLGNTGAEVTLKPVQVSFDPTVNFIPESGNGILKEFYVYGVDKSGNVLPSAGYKVDASESGKTTPVEFKDAAKIRFVFGNGTTTGFVPTATAATKYPGGWVYRIEAGGKTIKTFVDSKTDFAREAFDIDVDDKLPTEIKVSAIPNVKVTLSAGDAVRTDKANVWTNAFTYAAENGQHGSQAVDVANISSYFYVEPGKVVSVDGITAAASYLFAYVDGATSVLGDDDKWTLGEVTEDKTFTVDVKEFALFNKTKYELGSALEFTKIGNGTLSIDKVDCNVATVFDEGAASKTCSGNQVFKYVNESTPLTIQFKLDGDDAFEYNIDKVTFKYWAGNGYKTYPETPVTIYKYDSENHYRVALPAKLVRDTLIKDGKINLQVTTNEISRKYGLMLEDTTGEDSVVPTITNGGVTIIDKMSDATKLSPMDINYGSNLLVKVEPKAGYKLVSVNIIEADKNDTINFTKMSENKVTNITDAKKLAEFTGKGYAHKMGKETDFQLTTEKAFATEVIYTDNSKEPTLASKKYQVNHKRPVKITYKNGSAALADGKFSYSIMIGKDSVSDNKGITKGTGSVFTVDGANKDGALAGKTLVFKFWTGDGSAKDTSLQTVTLVIDGEDTGITFKNTEEKMDVGATKTFNGTVKGTINAKAIIKPAIPAGMELGIEKGQLTVKTTAKTPKGSYDVLIVDKDNETVEYGKIKITLNYDSIESAPKPIVKVTNTTNRRIFLSLKQNKLDTKIDGLYFKINVKLGTHKESLFLSERTMYVPITTTSCYVDMFKDGLTDAQLYQGDSTAEFKVTVQVVQGYDPNSVLENAYPHARKITTSITENGAKGTAETADTKGQAGKVFATKVTLKKVTKGNPMTNMGAIAGAIAGQPAVDPYVISVGYDKNCQVQQISDIKIYDKHGTEINNGWANYIDNDDYTIQFKPANGLAAGTYTIEVFALEPSSVPVSGKIKLNLKQAINDLSVEGSTDVIYKLPGTKATAEFVAYDTTNIVGNPKVTKKVEWSIVDKTDTTKTLDFGKNIVLKNGKLTIKKDYVLPKDGVQFKIKVKAKDYGANTAVAYTDTITLMGAPDRALNLAFSATSGGFNSGNLKDLENSYTVKELFGTYNANEDDKYEYVTYVAAYDKAKTSGAQGHYVPATFKVSGAAKLLGTYYGNDNGEGTTTVMYAKIGLNKLGKFKIVATAADGSADKKAAPNRIVTKEVNVTAGGTLGYTFLAGGILGTPIGSAVDANAGKSVSVNNYQAEGDKIYLQVLGYAKNAAGTGYDDSFINHKVAVKGGKLAKIRKSGANDLYEILPNDSKTVVTFTNTDTKAKFDVTVTNYAIGAKNVKSAITAQNNNGLKVVNGQIWSYLNFDGGAVAYDSVSYNKVTYTITKGAPSKNGYALVSVVKDNEKGGNTIFTVLWNMANNLNKAEAVNNTTYAIPLDGNKFVIDYVGIVWDTVNGKWVNSGKFNITPGTYKLNITPAEKKDGKFIATAKASTISVSAKKAPKANVKPKTSVEWNNSTHKGTVPAGNYKNYITSGKVTFIGVLDTNTKGQYNNFQWTATKKGNFAIDGDTNTTGTLVFKGEKAIDAKAKSELQGWVTYRYQALDGTTETQNIKVTIKPAKGATEVK